MSLQKKTRSILEKSNRKTELNNFLWGGAPMKVKKHKAELICG